VGTQANTHVDGAVPPSYAIAAAVAFAAVVDALLIAAWIALAADNLWLARRERAARQGLGPVVHGGSGPGLAVRLGVLGVLLGCAVLLERGTGGRLTFHPVAAAAGLALAVAGVALHLRARRALGPFWSGPITVRAGHAVVTSGPYALVRHPLYLGVLLLAAGTVLAHTSLATVCIALGVSVGIGLKMRAEERALVAICGEAYTRYAAEVPALIPRPARLRAALAGAGRR
jgi:protein-S-isoprenylcysteine O-methyltransferase Ste14